MVGGHVTLRGNTLDLCRLMQNLAMLLIPPMGQMKFGKGMATYGKNELIARYLQMICELQQQSQDNGPVPNKAEEIWWTKGRKQISSHLQVLKRHCATLPTCKISILVLRKPEKRKEEKKERKKAMTNELFSSSRFSHEKAE